MKRWQTIIRIQTIVRMLTMAWLLGFAIVLQAQTTISGVVLDKQTERALSHVSIATEGKDIHTVTNDDGRFTLKTKQRPQYIQLSHIGYKTRRVNLTDHPTEQLRILMTSSSVELREIIVSVDDPLSIIKAAMSRIEQNYPHEPELMRCFYRETAQRGSRFISVSEGSDRDVQKWLSIWSTTRCRSHHQGAAADEHEVERHLGSKDTRRSGIALDG
ncbi:MAG: carboxypeptidase-like regulatory domain-containing protein [Prevotella sp.]|nr:carboxypeptidase-like regulatory domain-containing protein [Prevotella sp.]